MIVQSFRKSFDVSSRSDRREFWSFLLFVLVAQNLVSIIEVVTVPSVSHVDIGIWFPPYARDHTGPLTAIFMLAIFFPSVTVSIRRLHDVGRTGWWYLLALMPVIGWLALLYWFVSEGDEGPNDYGPNPLDATFKDAA